MNVDCFLDTNVLVYAAAGRDADERKRRGALRLIETESFGVSAQCLQEFYVAVTRKAKKPMSPELALEWIEQLEKFPCMPMDVALVKSAIVLSERFQISYWDAAILAAAAAMGAKVLYTEDLNHGQQYGVVRAVNPFL